jgi:hypothetical protein
MLKKSPPKMTSEGNIMQREKRVSIFLVLFYLILFGGFYAFGSVGAPGAPGAASTWSYAGKTGIGTSYEQYLDNQYR